MPPGIIVDIYNIPYDCPHTWDLLCRGNVKGIFQLEGGTGKTWAKQVKPRSMEELSALVALLRPGCISGDTQITVRMYERNGRNWSFVKKKIRDLYTSFKNGRKSKDIISLDETTNTLFRNEFTDIFYSGMKKVYQPIFRCSERVNLYKSFYELECTDDHPLLVHNKGWVQLKDIQIGDRVAVLNSTRRLKQSKRQQERVKNFRSICLQNYEYRCVFCDWLQGSLDVNHITDNRKIDNGVDNLCFMCPNHHREYTEGKISKQDVIKARQKFILPNTMDILWAQYIGKDYIGIKDTYDITVGSTYHNFVAGNVVVHNCLRALSGDPPMSMTKRYCERKHFREAIEFFNVQELKPILEKTYGVLVYQEQSMQISVSIAGFDEQTADILRKAIGKKKADIMTKVKKDFIGGCKETEIVTPEKAEEIFGWIQESQRYSFNKSHSMSYGTGSYWTAYLKTHFPTQFYCQWLKGANWKQETYREIKELVEDAKMSNISVNTPDFRDMQDCFYVKQNKLYFGMLEIRQIGQASVDKILHHSGEVCRILRKLIPQWSWLDYLIYFSDKIPSGANTSLVSVGALDYYRVPRNKMLYEFGIWHRLTDKEKMWIKDNQYIMNFRTEKQMFSATQEPTWNNLADALKRCQLLRKEGGGCHNKNRKKIIENLEQMLRNPPHSLQDSPHSIAWNEEHFLGAAITCSELDGYEDSIKANSTCKEILTGKAGYLIIAVAINRVHQVKTKHGDDMAFITASDHTGSLDDIVCFPEAWSKYKGRLYVGNSVLINGDNPRRDGSLICKTVWQL
jgi:DNA polymerase III alpha subunit